MTLDWILAVGTLVFAVTTWATLSFGYAYFRALGRRDEAEVAGEPVTDPRPPAALGATPLVADTRPAQERVPG